MASSPFVSGASEAVSRKSLRLFYISIASFFTASQTEKILKNLVLAEGGAPIDGLQWRRDLTRPNQNALHPTNTLHL